MKNIIFIILMSAFSFTNINAQEVNNKFYYYKGEKIQIKERPDKIYVKFAENTTKKQVLDIIQDDSYIQKLNVENRILI